MLGLLLSLCLVATGTGPFDTVLDDWTEVQVYPESHIVLIGCTVCMNDSSPGMDGEFSQRTQGWSGCSDGRNDPHFIFKSMVPNTECNAALVEAGAVPFNQFPVANAVERMQAEEAVWDDYLNGSKVMVSVRWIDEGGELRETAFERFFEEQGTGRNGETVIKEFTPHYVYHGSNELNEEVNYGCLVCQQDCSGGLVCNNAGPCCSPVPMMRPNWDIIPEPGTPVTLVIYVMPER
jgi:hypothetical protein